ncbi:hypothetical protein ZMO1_ZMO1483 [Zymomonas mobilis subsp. mobilis ZM4 = ATCC 31821]|uniref:Uncharacterized protein n=1 Tax=Zymomonas mobilis subsp. mobilis (strain ATCC 31821 / ZM4 / CP4) TaxID=264203 RepID=Q5NMF3_ZYMMO|nr:hypothetical protein ZMO1483 [Zymomonas mobilis subsp. mobilis ZM4 = ATCC 31821]AVZ26327.1 hypothetical protein ZMO2_ZMO1483 [Zymomonas mobilis subsp. mobilis]AVZ28214.1 hypothetical protein ZMO3_ZMO1483 [Zymomonas mobilis subsp. mobilis]AVZ42659.1 hypothetical protein ZMO1_ZMO1483 [Zymomonas mobilis subsp. mobilis ZM4 = ATCC 31821]HCE37440.1 hypothetical protein [Zymomonas mobilis]
MFSLRASTYFLFKDKNAYLLKNAKQKQCKKILYKFSKNEKYENNTIKLNKLYKIMKNYK